MAGQDNDLLFEAGELGSDLNDANIVIEYGDVPAGREEVAWDPDTSTLRVTVHQGLSIARDVAAHVHDEYLAGRIPIDATVDPVDDLHGGKGVVHAATATLTGGSGQAMDRSSGLRITNGGETTVVTFDSAVTVEDLLNQLNMSQAGVQAAINADGTSIDVRSRLSDDDFSIGENSGQTATELGLRTFTEDTLLTQLNYGAGISDDQSNGTEADFSITTNDGFRLDIDVDGATDIGEVLRRINEDLNNGGRITAQLATQGNGIELVHNSGPGTITVAQENLSQVANRLGLIDGNATSKSVTTETGPATFQGNDVNLVQTGGVFTALLVLQRALLANDVQDIERGLELLNRGSEQVTFSRAELGARQQGLEVIQARQEDEQVELKAGLSQDLDVDYVDALSEFTARQIAYEASLRAAASIFQMTLLDYL
jgi:flagellar hook-associated protein 3 FlgL